MFNPLADYSTAIAVDASVLEAIEHLKSTIDDSLGDEVKGFAIRRLDCGEDSTDEISFVVLVATIGSVSRAQRKALRDKLLGEIAASKSRSVRECVTFTFR